MARALVLLLVALTATTVLAEKTSLPLNADSIAEVFKGFSEELQNTLHSTTNHGRSMLGLQEDAHSFFKDILGGNWSDHVPAAWKDHDFSLDKLIPFDLKHSLDDFLENSQLDEFRRPHTIPELHDLFESTLAKFCKNFTFNISEKVDPFCAGPTVSLTYNPKVCIIDELKKQIICTPASITLTKEPGVCVKKAFTPTIFIGKSCAIRKTIGVEAEVVIGGGEFVVPLNKYFPLSDKAGEKLEAKFSKFHKFDKIIIADPPTVEPETEFEAEPAPEPEPEIPPVVLT
uniref:Uncharacterized protein n=1 Tax=Auxenochlorella protothecoides TaxID=3075 RepID=A0A1D2ABS7_AUXPR